MAVGVAAVEAVAAIPATATAAAIPAVEAVAAIPATGDELEAERVAEALVTAAKAKETPPVVPVDAIAGDKPVKPEGVPDKFWDADKGEVNYTAWNKAHTELETQFHADKGKSPEVLAAEKVLADAAAPEGKPAPQNDAVEAARLEFAEKGELTPETYTKLASAGLDKGTVDSYISGVNARSGELTDAAHEATQGKENYTKMLEWAGENLSDQEVTTFNALVASNDTDVIKDAVAGVFAKYKENVTVEGDRLGGGGSTTSTSTFASKAEMIAAMNLKTNDGSGKTKYETDAAYRIEVQNRIKASRKAGMPIFV